MNGKAKSQRIALASVRGRAGWVVLLAATALLLAGCLAEDGAEDGGGGGTVIAADVNNAISSASCIGCHGINDPDLSDVATLVGATETGTNCIFGDVYVDSNSPSTSALYLALSGGRTSPCDMAVYDSGGTISDLVFDWISAGAL